jgi:Ca-activated chloride channel family protein
LLGFEQPGWFILFIFFPPLMYLRHFWPNRGGTISISFMNWGGGGYPGKLTFHSFFAGIFSLSFWVGSAMLLVALAGPVMVERERIYLTRGIDIMILLDVSPSMAAQDTPGLTRFDSAVSTIQGFVQRRTNDPLGLIVYSSQAALRVPPTLDYDFFLESLSQVQIGDMGDATALGTALALGAMHLSQSTAPIKVLILLTDGEQNAGEILPQTAVQLLVNQGIRLYTVGIGTTGPVPIEFTDPISGELFRGTYEGRVDHQLLTQLATQTGGSHFQAASPGALNAVFQGIDGLERTETRVRIQVNREPIHRTIILFGFGLILLEFFGKKLLLKEVL